MVNKRHYFFAGLLIFLVQACQSGDGTKDIRNFYFPLKTLESGLVYEYAPQGDTPASTAYWYYRTIIQDEEIHLTGTYYERDLIPQQLSNELMTEAGMVLEELYLFQPDTTGGDKQIQIPVSVVQDDVFPFRVRENGGVYLYHVAWESIDDPGAEMALIKNRRYLRDTTFQLDGKSYPAILFEVKELVSYDKDGVLEQQYDGKEIYAKGLGLVYYSKKVTEALNLRYRLEKRYPMEQLEEQFRSLYQRDANPNGGE